jgi:hypothetical protein
MELYAYKRLILTFSRLNRVLGDIFRKPTTTNFAIPYNSNYPIENKLATCSLIINSYFFQKKKEKKLELYYRLPTTMFTPRPTVTQLNERIQNKLQSKSTRIFVLFIPYIINDLQTLTVPTSAHFYHYVLHS